MDLQTHREKCEDPMVPSNKDDKRMLLKRLFDCLSGKIKCRFETYLCDKEKVGRVVVCNRYPGI